MSEAIEWLNTLARVRRTVVDMIARIGAHRSERNRRMREISKLRATGNRFDDRRADIAELDLEAWKKQREEAYTWLHERLQETGKGLLITSSHIDAAVPRHLLLDFLGVNEADRKDLKPDDGFINLAYAHGLEYSATYRGSDWKQGPFAQAIMEGLLHEMAHNPEMQKAADDHLFGRDGLFEFVPRYVQNGAGEMIRQPPPLRLA
jgi:hypothetical protein